MVLAARQACETRARWSGPRSRAVSPRASGSAAGRPSLVVTIVAVATGPISNEIDAVLLELVHAANAGAEIGLTVTVSGQVVTGTLISERVYLTGLARDLEQTRALGGAVSAGVENLESDLYTDVPDGPTGGGSTFFHLKSARYLSAGSLVPYRPNANGVWRGRVDHVSGWVLGTLTSRSDLPVPPTGSG